MTDRPDDIQQIESAPVDVDLDRVWSRVAADVWAPSPGRVERLATRLLGSPGIARALVITPSLLLSWLIASAVVLGIGALLTSPTGTPWVALLAPALAGAGIAYAYGPGVDPAFELVRAAPVSFRMILLTRALAVFGVNALLGLGASLFTSTALGLTFGWLIPMTTVSALGLASATLARSANVGVAAALAGWGLIVLSSSRGTQDLGVAVTEQSYIPLYLAGTLLMVALTIYASSSRRERRSTWQLP